MEALSEAKVSIKKGPGLPTGTIPLAKVKNANTIAPKAEITDKNANRFPFDSFLLFCTIISFFCLKYLAYLVKVLFHFCNLYTYMTLN